MDAKEQLNRKYANTAIYTSAFYADPDDPLKPFRHFDFVHSVFLSLKYIFDHWSVIILYAL